MKQGIILAAGLGSRLREITSRTPKSLIKINGKPILEQNIEYMVEAGFDRIILVAGYKKEKFDYLKEKYNNIDFIFVFNMDFGISNTISSLFYVKNYLCCKTYITTADIYLTQNPYLKYKDNINFYLLRAKTTFNKPDWVAELNQEENFRILAVNKKGYEGHSYTGISHWTLKGTQFIREKLQSINWNSYDKKDQHCDELLIPHFKTFGIFAKVLESNSELYEFDDFSDIKFLANNQNVLIDY